MFISQTTDFHFANYRFSFRKLQISISQTTDSHFANYRFPFPFRFVPFRFANYSKPSWHAKCSLVPRRTTKVSCVYTLSNIFSLEWCPGMRNVHLCHGGQPAWAVFIHTLSNIFSLEWCPGMRNVHLCHGGQPAWAVFIHTLSNIFSLEWCPGMRNVHLCHGGQPAWAVFMKKIKAEVDTT